MTPVIVSMRGGWGIYMRPSYSQALAKIEASWGSKYDPIERQVVTGGVPEPIQRMPGVFATKAEAVAAIRGPL